MKSLHEKTRELKIKLFYWLIKTAILDYASSNLSFKTFKRNFAFKLLFVIQTPKILERKKGIDKIYPEKVLVL